MPDWTYLPLRRVAERVVGPATARRGALALVAQLARSGPGRTLIRGFDFTRDLPATRTNAGLPSPCGIVLDSPGDHQVAALRAMGFGWVSSAEEAPAGAVRPASSDFESLVELARRRTPIILNDAAIEHGPTVAQRINEVLESDTHSPADATVQWFKPWTWHSWVWALWLGIAMVCAGVGAAIITYGPVLLGYDERFLKTNPAGLDSFNPKLIPFLQHDRITMAGCMAAIGANDIGMAFAMRRGWPWARANFIVAGAVGFPTFFLFLGYRFVDPLHLAVAVGFFPLYLLGAFGKRIQPSWTAPDRVNEVDRRRAAVGQLLMICVGIGVTVSGAIIMWIGLRSVLIPTDRAFLQAQQSEMVSALDGRLLRFIAHDRAGFGGALTSLGVGVTGTALWGWRHGLRSTIWSTAAASFIGLGAALIVHLQVGYTDAGHLLPVYVAIPTVGVALLLSREWLSGRG
jgi:hypothetical protein